MSKMKKKNTYAKYSYIVTLVFISMICIQTETYSQNTRPGNKSDRQIIGTWKMDLGKSKTRMNAEKRSALNDLDAQSRSQIESKYINRELIFRKDGSFSMMIKGNQVIFGTWKITPKRKSIIVTPEIGVKYRYDIVSLNTNGLRIKPRVKSESSLLFPEWHLIKK